MLFLHPLQGCSLKNLLILYKNNKLRLPYLPRAMFICLRGLIGMPFEYFENRIYTKQIRAVTVPPPIFILGHWRSGTTLLQNTLTIDPQFCYPTWGFTYTPNAPILGRHLINTIGKVVGSVARPMDEMRIHYDAPQEDEFILGNMGPFSLYHHFYFPSNRHYYRYLDLDKMTPAEKSLWKQQLMDFYQRLTFINSHKPIISKNPPHTSRIKYLLELFPDAKFVHIYRNPYVVYLSTLKAMKAIITEFSLEPYDASNLSYDIFITYNQLMKNYFTQKKLIPSANLIEIRFEDFEKHPIEELENIYLSFGLSGFNQIKNQFIKYFESLKEYKKNQFSLTPTLADEIYRHWHYTINLWNYNYDSLLGKADNATNEHHK